MSHDTGSSDTTREPVARRLSDFLRTVRTRTAPTEPTQSRRRVRGLRREEVAVRAGISVTWYTWLEQGRPVRPSTATLRNIAAALRMSPAETDHLLSLAPAAGAPAPTITPAADGALLLLVETLGPHPAYAVNGQWDVLAANRSAEWVLGRFAARPGVTDNILRRFFLDRRWTEGFDGWDALADSVVAQFRGATASLAGAPEVRAFVTRLAQESPAFATRWAAHAVVAPKSHEKCFRHPTAGWLRFHYSSVAPDGAPPDVRVIVYRAADRPTARVLAGQAARKR